MASPEQHVGSSFSEHRASEAFHCERCGYDGTLVIEALAVVTRVASAADPRRLEWLASRQRQGGLGPNGTAELRQLEDSAHLQAAHGSVEAGVQKGAERAAPAAAERRAAWLADTARCPRCQRPRAERYARRAREELVARAPSALFVGIFAGVASFVLLSMAGDRPSLGACAAIALTALGIAAGAQLSFARAKLLDPCEAERRFIDRGAAG